MYMGAIGRQFRESKYVSRPMEAFILYLADYFQRFLKIKEQVNAYYGLYLSIVQSSGTGKSRLISEVLYIQLFLAHKLISLIP